jgi:hypothetical protein
MSELFDVLRWALQNYEGLSLVDLIWVALLMLIL